MVLTRTRIGKVLSVVMLACLVMSMMSTRVSAAGEFGFFYVAELLTKKIYQFGPNDPNLVEFLTDSAANPGVISHDWNSDGTVICVAGMNGGVSRFTDAGVFIDHNYSGVAWGIAVDGEDNVWVTQRELVKKFNSDLSVELGSFDFGVTARGALFEGLSYDPSSDHLFVAITETPVLTGGGGWLEIDTSGNLIFETDGPIGHIRPQIGPDGRLYVGVGGGPSKNKILVFERDPVEIWTVSDVIETVSELNSLAWDNDGNMYGANANISSVTKFEPPLNINTIIQDFAPLPVAAGIGFKRAKLPVATMCINPPLGDTNGDCIVDINELATLSQGWLDCGLQSSAECP